MALHSLSSSRPLQLATTAVVSGAVAVGLVLGVQRHARAARLQRLKRAVAEAEEEARRKTKPSENHDDDDTDAIDDEERRALALARRAQAGDYSEEVVLEQLTRTQAFLTAEGLARVRGAFVVVVGCGGVGSHCAAALARSGVGRLRLVDFDQVSLSSLNRHAVATLADVGRPKVQVLARRLQAVAPWVVVEGVVRKFDAGSASALLGGWSGQGPQGPNGGGPTFGGSVSGPASAVFDGSGGMETAPSFIVDAIDNIDTKVALLRYCHDHGLPVVAAMGAGTKSDPTRVVVGDLAASTEDGLARAVRRRLKLAGITSGVTAVYSTEPGPTPGDGRAALLPLPDDQFARLGAEGVRELGALPDFRVRILPVLGTLPAVFGCTAANHVLLTLAGYPYAYTALKGRDKLYDQVLAAVHGFEEKLVRQREKTVGMGKEVTGGGSAAVGLRVPLTAGDVAFLLEEVYHGRSAVSGLATRTTLVRWALPEGDDNTTVDSLFDRVTVPPEVVADHANNADNANATTTALPLLPEQRTARLRLADLVCMTREEAARHQAAVLLGGQDAAALYDAATLARIAARRADAAAWEEHRV